jgi:uncharacterized protein involved in response to NO
MALWPLAFSGTMAVPTAFSLVDWHAHEMIFGYAGAVVAGFLFTAIPNWTGRLPVAGAPLAALASLWMAGRAAVFASAYIGRVPAGIIDAGFLAIFAAMIAREVIAGRNGRNAKVVALVVLLALINIAFHIEDARAGLAEYSTRAAIAAIVGLVLLIGGRVTPSFTNNWLARAGVAERPAPFGPADTTVLVLSGATLALWTLAPHHPAMGALALAAGAANLWRLSRWRGLQARRDALVFVLHAGYLFAALGFLAAGATAFWPTRIPYATGVHVWAVGAVGTMTLAIMTRATLGHTGRALVASKGTILAYACMAVAALARFAMALLPDFFWALFGLAAGVWILGFVVFLVIYAPILTGRGGKA